MKQEPVSKKIIPGKLESRLNNSLEAIVGCKNQETIQSFKIMIMNDIRTLYSRGFRTEGDKYIQQYGQALEKLGYKKK